MYQHWVVDDTVNSKHKYDAVVVLAGIVPSKCYLESDQTYVKNMFICSADFKRAYAGLSFIKNGQANRFVFGDDTSSGAYEVKAVKEFLLDNQVESEQIIITGEVKNTQDEALRVDRLVKNGDINDFILVTSAMHMRRAAAIFEDLGLTPALYSTNKKERNKITIKDFRPHSTSGVYRMLYEFAGYVKFILKK
jgi:uncharacterized SAM-binding protein YcdF (DUF218 family)